MWTVVDVSVWQPSVPQFSAPASLEVERKRGRGGGGVVVTRDINSDCETNTHKNIQRDHTRTFKKFQLRGRERFRHSSPASSSQSSPIHSIGLICSDRHSHPLTGSFTPLPIEVYVTSLYSQVLSLFSTQTLSFSALFFSFKYHLPFLGEARRVLRP